jgi:protein-S-isoprenylcysteine O-methyltransferase Ste14
MAQRFAGDWPTPTQEATMKHRIRRIDPMQAAKMATVIYLILGLVFVPFLMLASMAAPTGFGIGFAIAMPLMYAVFGFVFTLIGAFIYNLVAGWVGGVELELDVPAQA